MLGLLENSTRCHTLLLRIGCDVLYLGPNHLFGCQHYVALQAGLIINIGSIAGEAGKAGQSVYAATKWGLRGWSLSNYEVSPFASAYI